MMDDNERLGLQSMPPELMKLAKDQFGPHYIQFEIWAGHLIDTAFELGKRSTEADQRDAARLDDMERTRCYPFWNGSGWTYIVAAERSSKVERKGVGATVREAIDAAMRQSDIEER